MRHSLPENEFHDRWERWRQGLRNLERLRRQYGAENIRTAQRRHDVVANWVAQVAEKGRLLDIGCGSGMLRESRHFPSTFRYVGFDPLQIPNLSYNFPFVVGVVEQLPFRPHTFDTILIKDSIDYFAGPGAALESIASVLSRRGVLLITESGHDDPAILMRVRRFLVRLGGRFRRWKVGGWVYLYDQMWQKLLGHRGEASLTHLDTYPSGDLSLKQIHEIVRHASFDIRESTIRNSQLFLVARLRP